MPLGTEEGLDPGDIVLDGTQLRPSMERGTAAPPLTFPPMCVVTWLDGRIYQDTICHMEVGFGPGDIVLDKDPAPPHRKGHSRPPLFGWCLLWLNGCPSQQLLSSCSLSSIVFVEFLLVSASLLKMNYRICETGFYNGEWKLQDLLMSPECFRNAQVCI